jgi:hypothetical protein
MWLSSKRYDTLWEEKYKLQKEKDTLIRLLSGIVIANGGKIIIPMPSSDSRTLRWKEQNDGSLIIESEVCGLTKGELHT